MDNTASTTTTAAYEPPRMGDCPQGGDHAWKAEKVANSIIYTCTKCGAGR